MQVHQLVDLVPPLPLLSLLTSLFLYLLVGPRATTRRLKSVGSRQAQPDVTPHRFCTGAHRTAAAPRPSDTVLPSAACTRDLASPLTARPATAVVQLRLAGLLVEETPVWDYLQITVLVVE